MQINRLPKKTFRHIRSLLILVFVACLIGCATDENPQEYSATGPDVYDPYFQPATEPDADSDDRLCLESSLDPQQVIDKVNIQCEIERAEGEAEEDLSPETIRIVTWNILRGFEWEAILRAMDENEILSQADVLLLQEVDRGCPRSGSLNIAARLADALDWHYAYGVEFIELAQDGCEHGNAVISRYPISQVNVYRLPDFEKWFEDEGEPRLGGRMVIVADLQINGRQLQVASLHAMSKVNDYNVGRVAQINTTLDALDFYPGPTVLGGDFNTGFYYYFGSEQMIDKVLERSYQDALAGLPQEQTVTSLDPIPMRLDWLFYRGPMTIGGGVVRGPLADQISDHLAVYADFPANSF